VSDYIDISPLVTNQSALFPGEWRYEHSTLFSLEKGDACLLGGLRLSPHVGAHADAPSHFSREGLAIDELDLRPYFGPCYVFTCENVRFIQPGHLTPIIDRKCERILFRTLSANPQSFSKSFTTIAPETIDFLGEKGVKLIGIDTPSLDPADSKELPSHHALLKWNMRNLEGLFLKEAPDGEYELIALPLKLHGAEASPVRAVLRQMRR